MNLDRYTVKSQEALSRLPRVQGGTLSGTLRQVLPDTA
jgi:hypothetical protein